MNIKISKNEVIFNISEEFTIVKKEINGKGKIINKSIDNKICQIKEGIFNKNKNLKEGTIEFKKEEEEYIITKTQKGIFENNELNCSEGKLIIELIPNKKEKNNKLKFEIIGKYENGKSIDNVEIYSWNIIDSITTKKYYYKGTINEDDNIKLSKGLFISYEHDTTEIKYKTIKNGEFDIDIINCSKRNINGKSLMFSYNDKVNKVNIIYEGDIINGSFISNKCKFTRILQNYIFEFNGQINNNEMNGTLTIKQPNNILIIKKGKMIDEKLNGIKCKEYTYYNNNLISQQEGIFENDQFKSGYFKRIDDYKEIIYQSDNHVIYKDNVLTYNGKGKLKIILYDEKNQPYVSFNYKGIFDTNINYPHFKSGKFFQHELNTNQKMIQEGSFILNNDLIPLLHCNEEITTKSMKRIKINDKGIKYEKTEGIFKNGIFIEGLYQFIIIKSNKEYLCKYNGEVKIINNNYCFTTSANKVSSLEIYDNNKLLQKSIGIFEGTIDDPYKFINGEISQLNDNSVN